MRYRNRPDSGFSPSFRTNRRTRSAQTLLLLWPLAAPIFCQEAVAGGPPRTHYIEVEPRGLEELDWGGNGRAVVRLADNGRTVRPPWTIRR
jgi:hypothetical protein